MVKRRDFVGEVGAIVATHFLPEFAFAETLPAANLVPPPRGGLHANYNYYLYAGGNPITDLSVEVHLTEDLVAEAGFSIQLNGWSPTNARSVWQQYCYGFYTENIAKPQISWSIENWPTSEYREYLHRTIGLRIPSDLFNLHGQRVMVPGPGVKVPKGYKFRIALVHDPKDASGAIIGAAYSVIDNHDKTIIDDRPLIRSYKFSHTNSPIEAAALAPIITFQVNICKRAGSHYGFMELGAGTITYTSATPLTVLNKHPEGMAAPGIITAEWANTVYSELPAGPALRFAQTFDTVKAPAFQPGGPFAVSRRFDADRTDLFVVSVSGRLVVFSSNGAARWERSGGHGPVNMARPGTSIAATKRFGVDNQTGVFLIAQNGQLQAFWVGPNGVNGPIPVGLKGVSHPGAPLTAARQFGGRDQTDVFLFDTTGQLHAFWAHGAGSLNGPAKIGPPNFAPNNAQLAAWQRPGTKQTDVFTIDKSGALCRFWVDGGGHWNGPEKISASNFAKPGGHVAAGQRSGKTDQTDVFLFDRHGQLNVFSSKKEGSWSGPEPIGPTGFADPGAAIAVADQAGRGRTSVFVVDKKGTLIVFAADDAGRWGAPEDIGQPGDAPSGAYVVASPHFGVAKRTDVFVVNNTKTKASGWPELAWVDENNVWTGPKKLSADI